MGCGRNGGDLSVTQNSTLFTNCDPLLHRGPTVSTPFQFNEKY